MITIYFLNALVLEKLGKGTRPNMHEYNQLWQRKKIKIAKMIIECKCLYRI
jgi:hypothetical protein